MTSDFSQRIKELRLSLNLTKEQLAEEIGVSDSAVGHWERGTRRPSIDVVIALASFFGVSLGYMAGVEDY